MPESEKSADAMGKPDKTPLFMKLYFQEVYTEVARIVGYAGFPRDQLEEKMKDLVVRFGRKRIQEVCSELITLQFNGKEKRSGPREEAEVRLKADVRKLCWQLLGPTPEKMEDFNRVAPRQPDEPPKQGKKPRAKKLVRQPEPKTTSAAGKPSPIMQQYLAAKGKHPGMLLLFRIGDFYEVFGEDADDAHKLLGLTLTSRDGTTMAGFPHHQLETYLHKLLKEGRRVAVCDPVPETMARGPITREVTRVVMPGKAET